MLQKFSSACGIRRPRSGKVAIQRRGRHPETVGNIADGNIGIGEQRPRNVEISASAVGLLSGPRASLRQVRCAPG